MPLRVHLHDLEHPDFRAALAEHLDPSIELVPAEAPHELLVCGVPTAEMLDRGPHTVVVPWSGIPRSVAALLAARPHIALHNIHHNAAPVAEHALGLLLASARRLVPADRLLRSGDWSYRFTPTDAPLLAGRRALILGAGALAQRIAAALVGLDVTPTLLGRTARAGVLGPADLDAALATAEVLVVTLPWTAETEGLLDARRLALLPAGALLVNVGRGPVVDEEALYRALERGHLAGAGIDVWYEYPKTPAARLATHPSRFDFAALDSVVLSPHRAGHGLATERLCAEHLAVTLNAAARGEPLPGRVDPVRGY
jgi:phosphoglycerate dehydrogenase-like enzyme